MRPTPLRPEPRVYWLSVFGAGPGGGNPAPIMLDADGLSDERMREVARVAGHESGFVLRPAARDDVDFEFRFWVPHHEMEMCGHVTVGAVWLLHGLGRLATDVIRVRTRSGVVTARVDAGDLGGVQVEISQPRGRVDPLADPNVRAEILAVLRAPAEDLAPLPVQNASTSRVKTLVPMASIAALDRLAPDFTRIEALCERIRSTGLYPYTAEDPARGVFRARQFPKSSGYPEDAATGIAAAALGFGLLESGVVTADRPSVQVLQGQAMGRPSAITIRFRRDPVGGIQGCWIGGKVELDPGPSGGSR